MSEKITSTNFDCHVFTKKSSISRERALHLSHSLLLSCCEGVDIENSEKEEDDRTRPCTAFFEFPVNHAGAASEPADNFNARSSIDVGLWYLNNGH